jgi:Tyrosine phosphatase family
MEHRRKRRSKRIAIWATLFLLPPLVFIGWNQATHNLGVLQPKRIYRSGQMPAGALSRTLRDYQIRTVLNLRGPNPGESWYRDELAATLAAGATQVDLPWSSCVWMSRIQLRTLIRTLDTCDYPLIMHCAWGSERTGLASAIVKLLQPGQTLADARDQLVLRHLYVRLGDGRIMAEFLDQYEEWLRRNRQGHSPEVFRSWAAQGYVPGSPNREEWPYDPAPLVVVTHPRPPFQSLAGRGIQGEPPLSRTR